MGGQWAAADGTLYVCPQSGEITATVRIGGQASEMAFGPGGEVNMAYTCNGNTLPHHPAHSQSATHGINLHQNRPLRRIGPTMKRPPRFPGAAHHGARTLSNQSGINPGGPYSAFASC